MSMAQVDLKEHDDPELEIFVMVHGTAWTAIAAFFRSIFHHKKGPELQRGGYRVKR